jgi:site-specific DNA-methyltransferase (adenine-specific)
MKPYYVDDAVTIYHGRAEEVLPQLGTETVGLVVTSPPYNLGDMEGGLANLAGGYESYADQLPHGDYVRWQRDILTECWRVITNEGAIFYNHKPRIRDGILWTPLELNPGLPLRQIIIWARTIGVNWSETFFMPMHEWVMLFAKPGFRFSKSVSHHGDVWRMPPEPDRSHPAPFPVGLPSRAIQTATLSTVLDPFMGSGTTLVAAKSLNRPSIGIEIEERYCEIAARRCSQEVLGLSA